MKINAYKKNGKTLYKFCAYAGRDLSTGKQRQVRRSGFKTKREAENAYLKIKAQVGDISTRRYTFVDMADMWLAQYKNTVRGSSYLATYRIIEKYGIEFFGNTYMDKITVFEVQEYVNGMMKKYTTGKKMARTIKAIFTYAYKLRIIKENPFDFVIYPKGIQKEKKENYYTKEELKQFLCGAEKHLSHMWYVFFHVLAYTGMRRGELLALHWEDIKGMQLFINKAISRDILGKLIIGSPKTKSSERVIDIDKRTLDLINSLDNDCDLIFHNTKNDIISFSQPVNKLHKVCSLENMKYISPHGFRHTHCSMLFASGVNIPLVQARLGHSSIATTMDIYNHVYKEDKKEALDKFMEYMKT